MNDKKDVWKYQAKKGEQFAFLHIPKTGGTTFRNILSRHFQDEDRYPNQADLLSNGGKYLPIKKLLLEKESFTRKKLIIGHYGIELIGHLHQGVKTLAFFRNPIDRIFSHIKHIQLYDSHLKGADPDHILDKRYNAIVNLQAKMMGFDRKKKNTDSVKKNIQSLDFIGIQERYDESLDLCNRSFGWHLEKGPKMNVSKTKKCLELSNSSMSRICRRLSPEIATYNTACRIFEKRLKENQ